MTNLRRKWKDSYAKSLVLGKSFTEIAGEGVIFVLRGAAMFPPPNSRIVF